ncbi:MULTISPECIES: alpha/beta hydrolase [Nocardia]|uniref:alpha/beta hydrolase n=1 Tax=Nocardia TaxID=1817 RepID=UPI000D6918A3|nr:MULTISPECIES: alpha/beta hydrolase [Nocardia]
MSEWALTRTDVASWDPAVLAGLADHLDEANGRYADELRRMTRRVAEAHTSWAGAAYDAASDRVDEDHRQASKINAEVVDLATVLRRAGLRLAGERANLIDKVETAENITPIAGETYRVRDDWTLRVGFADDTPADKRAEITGNAQAQQGLIDKAFFELRDAARSADRLIRAAAQQVRDAGNAVGEALDRPVVAETEDPGVDRAVSAPPANATVAQNAAWWDGLTDTERKEVVARHPEWIGNRDGIPAAARHEANVAVLATERQRLRQRLEKLNTDIDNHPTGGWFTDEDAERDLVKEKLASLDEVGKLLEANPEQGRLLVLDTSGERVKAAFSIGDPDTAAHISVAVPGKDTTVDRSLSGMVDEARGLQMEAEKALRSRGDDSEVAAIAWIGYEPPDAGGGTPWDSRKSLDNWVEGTLGSASEDRMRSGAPKLASFLEGLDTASTTSDPHITTLGHSYGSSTTALALQQLQAQGKSVVDDAVFLGSPGIFADDATDLGLRPGHAYLAEADDDPVADLGRFGGDPSFGDFDNLSTKDGVGYDGQQRDGVTGHSRYPHRGTITAYNFAMIAAGHPEMAVR